jgi:predicted MFS family arabinose efflux permease
MPDWLVILLTGATFFSVVVMNYIISPILPNIAREFRVTTSEAGLLVTVYGLLFATSALFLASISDAIGAKRMIIIALTVFGAATICTGLATTFWSLMLFRAISGLAASVVQTANWTVLAKAIPYARRGQATGWVMQAGTLALLLGVPLGGLLAQSISWHVIFLAVGSLALIIVPILARRLHTAAPPQFAISSRVWTSGLRDLWRLVQHGRARFALAISLLIWIAMHGFYTYMGAFLSGRFDLNAAQVGQITLVLGFGFAVGGQIGGRISDRFGREPVIIWGLLIMVIAFLGMPNAASELTAALLIIVLGFGYFFGYSAQVTTMTELAPETRSIAMAANYFVTYVGAAIGAWLGGLVLPNGFAAVGWVSTMAAALGVVLIVWKTKENLAVFSRVNQRAQ